MQYIPRILILACFPAALFLWFGLMIIFMDLVTMGQKVGFTPNIASVGRSGVFEFFVASVGLIALCFVSRRGLPVGSLCRPIAMVVICLITAAATLFTLALCTPYVAIADR